MPILGMRTTANFLSTQRPESWRENIALLYPNSGKVRQAPLTALTSVMKEKKVDDPVFHWFEKELNNRRFLLTANLGAVATGTAGTLTVDAAYNAATGVKKNDLLRVEATGEILLVSADPTATNTISVVRGVNGGAGLAVTLATAGTNPYVMLIGSAFEEGSLAPTGVNFDPSDRYNYTQILRSTMEATRTAMQTRLRTGDQMKEAKRECVEYFAVDAERAFFFAKRGLTTLNGKPLRIMSGVIEQIETASSANIVNFDPTGVDMDSLTAQLNALFAFGSSEKVAFLGNTALATLNEIVRKNTQYQIRSGEKEYGINITRFTTPFGELVFVPHPLFTQYPGGTVGGTAFYGLDSTAVILDMDYVKYVYLDDMKWDKDLTPVGQDGKKGGMIGEVSIELQFPKTHFVWNRLVKAKKDA